MDLYTFLTIAHIFGTVLGVGGATFAEIFYIQFKKSGSSTGSESLDKADFHENPVLKTCLSVLRWGLVILAFSGVGMLIMWRLNFLGPDVFFVPRFLAKMSVVLILLTVSLAINFKFINFELGSSISTASWYSAMILGLWRTLDASYFIIMIGYVVTVAFLHFVLQLIRFKVLRNS